MCPEKNREIVEKYLKNGLIDRCLDYQFSRLPKEYKEDYKNDLIIELLEYGKLEKVEAEGHMNAFLTRCIQNNVFSKTSWYYRRYIRWDKMSSIITEKEKEIPDA